MVLRLDQPSKWHLWIYYVLFIITSAQVVMKKQKQEEAVFRILVNDSVAR